MSEVVADPTWPQFHDAVWQRVRQVAAQAPIGGGQHALLSATFDYVHRALRGNPRSNPLYFFYLAVRLQAFEFDARAEWLGASCLLYISALDLLDDVQDADLAGKPHEAAGPAVALNSGLTLLILALVALEGAMAKEADTARQLVYLRLFTRLALTASHGQHVDLTGGARTVEAVLANHAKKGSAMNLAIELAALYTGAEGLTTARY